MALKVEEFEYMVEREGIPEFIWVRAFNDIEGTEIGLYEMANNRWGTIFRIFPPAIPDESFEKTLSSFFQVVFPEETSIRFFSFASRNLRSYLEDYKERHSTPPVGADTKLIQKIVDSRMEWIEEHRNVSIFQDKGYDFRLRDFVNLVVITIPKENSSGVEYTETEVINIFSKALAPLKPLRPKKFTDKEYVSLMREILTPNIDPIKSPPIEVDNDETFINRLVCDDDTIILIDEETSTIGIGSKIGKEEYIEILKEQNIRFRDDDEEEMEEDDSKKTFLQKIFEKKKKVEKKYDYTEYYAKGLVTKLYPAETDLLSMISNFFDMQGNRFEPGIPAQFFTSFLIYIHPKEKTDTDSGLIEKRNWVGIETEVTDETKRYIPDHAFISGEEVRSQKMSAMWTMAIFDRNKNKVIEYADRIKESFLEKKWVLQDETVIPQWLYLYSLPLQFEHFVLKFSMRMNTIFTPDNTRIIPIVSGERGDAACEVFFTDRMGQITQFAPVHEGGGSFVMLGMEHSGKSYFIKDLAIQLLAGGLHSFIIDFHDQYKEFADTFKIKRQKVTGKGIKFDIFKWNSSLTSEFLRVFVDSYLGQESDLIEDPFKELVAISSSLDDLIERIEWPKTREALETLRPGASYGFIFNGETEIDFLPLDIVYFPEDEEIDTFSKTFLAMAIYFIAIMQEERAFIVLDTKYDFFNLAIENLMKQAFIVGERKSHFMGIVARDPMIFAEYFPKFFNEADYQIVLKLDSDITSEENYKKMEPIFNPNELQAVRTIKIKIPLYTEFFIRKKGSDSFSIQRFFTDRISHWFYTDFDSDIERIVELEKKYGLSRQDARYIKGLSQKEKKPIEEIYTKYAHSLGWDTEEEKIAPKKDKYEKAEEIYEKYKKEVEYFANLSIEKRNAAQKLKDQYDADIRELDQNTPENKKRLDELYRKYESDLKKIGVDLSEQSSEPKEEE